MAQIQYRANLANDDFPLLSAFKGQTVIVGKFDQDFELEFNPNFPQRIQKEKQIADAYYLHNVVPTGHGYQSIGYVEKIPAFAGKTDFNRCFVLRDPSENKSFYSPAAGKNYIFDRNVGIWKSVNPISGFETALVTVSYLNGETYIFYQKVGCFKYDKTSGTIMAVALTGLTVANINGICSSNGFMLAWDDLNNVYRSQSASPLNFTPDPSLGSGAGIPEDIRGKIVILLPITNGFVVYTTANAVAGNFQQNIRYPFIYKEIEGSSGILSPDHVSWQDNSGEHYVWSKSGLQKVTKSKATPVFPKIGDFFTAKVFEDYDDVNDVFTITKLASQLKVRVSMIGSRYAVFSYGISSDQFTHAIMYDIAFKRFGKFKINHVDCFNYAVPNLSGNITWDQLGTLTWDDLGDTTWDSLGTQLQTSETPKEIVGFLGKDGQVKIINFDLNHLTGDAGVMVLGKYQFSRSNLLQLDEIAIENIDQGSDFSIRVLTAVDGKNITFVSTPFNDQNLNQFRNYLSDKVGTNHSIVAKGTFNIVSMELVMHPHGRS